MGTAQRVGHLAQSIQLNSSKRVEREYAGVHHNAKEFYMTIQKHTLSPQFIINCLNACYGIEVAELTFLPLGADMHASVYKAQTHDQRSYFVKLKRGHHHDIGIAIVELLHDAGIKQIIPPVKTILGQSTQYIEDFTLIVYPFINGQDGFSSNLTDDQWIKLGNSVKTSSRN